MEITCLELAAQLKGPTAPKLLDVRSAEEHQFVALPNSVFIPLSELNERIDELDALKAQNVVVYCHHGVRSQSGAAILRKHGFNAKSLRGGIEAWANQIDPTMARY